MSHSIDSFNMDAFRIALADVKVERIRTHVRLGEQNLPDGTGTLEDVVALDDFRRALPSGENPTFKSVLLEEVLEAFAESDPEALRAELVQVANVALQWIEKNDRARVPAMSSEASAR